MRFKKLILFLSPLSIKDGLVLTKVLLYRVPLLSNFVDCLQVFLGRFHSRTWGIRLKCSVCVSPYSMYWHVSRKNTVIIAVTSNYKFYRGNSCRMKICATKILHTKWNKSQSLTELCVIWWTKTLFLLLPHFSCMYNFYYRLNKQNKQKWNKGKKKSVFTWTNLSIFTCS